MRSHDSLHYHSSGNHMVDAERRLIGDDPSSSDAAIEQAADDALWALLNARDGYGSDDLFDYLHENLVENLLAAAKGDRVDRVVKYGSCASAKELLSTLALEWAHNRAEGKDIL